MQPTDLDLEAFSRLTRLVDVRVALKGLGYGLRDRNAYRNRLNAQHYDALAFSVFDLETGKGAFNLAHSEAWTTARYRALQALRTKTPPPIIGGRVLEF